MKTFIKENKILFGIVLVALIVAIAVIGGRINVETHNKSYDIILDYEELEKMAEQSDHDVTWWLEQFKDMGITKVGLAEESLNTLMENQNVRVNADVMADVMKRPNWEADYPDTLLAKMKEHKFDQYDVLVEADTPEDYAFILDGVKARYPSKKFYYEASQAGGYIVFDATPKDTLYTEDYKLLNSRNKGFSQEADIKSSKIMFLSLGMLPSKVDLLKNAGMEIVPRTASYEGWNDKKYAKAVIDEYTRLGIKAPYMIVGGEAVIGKDDGITTVDKYIKDNNISIGLIENTTQRQNILQYGVEDVVRNDKYNAVRVFSVWDYIQNRYKYYHYPGAEEIENTLFRAVVERNVRVIYFKPIKEYKDQYVYVTDVKEYQKMFSSLEKRLAEHNLKFGQASVMADYHVPMFAKILLGFGCVAGGLLVLKSFLPLGRKPKLILAVLGFLGVLASSFVIPNSMELVASFAASVIFPCLAIVWFTMRGKNGAEILDQNASIKKIIPMGVVTLICGILISLCGGIMTAAPISSINYFLEIDIFRGVKVAQLLPIAFFLVIYLAYFGYKEANKKDNKLKLYTIKDLMNTSIKIWMILLGVVVLAIGVYYIDRTGHETSVQVSSLEMIFRNILEDHLLARPRSKEFLFAFPCVMLFLYSVVRNLKLWPLLFGLASVIGMTSVTNTFMHIRTPLYLGFARTGYSALFGIIIGIVAVIVFDLLYKLYKKVERQIV